MLLLHIKLFCEITRRLELVFLLHFLHGFWRETFFLLYTIYSPNLIVWLPLLCKIMNNTFNNFFVFGLICTIIKKANDLLWSMVKKMFIKVRVCNLTTYVFKRHLTIVGTYMVTYNVEILNRPKIMGFL